VKILRFDYVFRFAFVIVNSGVNIVCWNYNSRSL